MSTVSAEVLDAADTQRQLEAVVALMGSDLLREAVEAELIHKDNFDFIDRVDGFVELFSAAIRDALSEPDAAFTAALPGVVAAAKAEAWDEGYACDWTGGVRWKNPYRKESE